MPVAEIITIGTELLLGETVDTNTRFLARELRSLGVDLYRALTVGDNVERIAEAVNQAMGRAQIVITTGGLGPTVDDPTRQAIAQAVGVELVFRQELWDQITARIARYGRTPGENQKRQAFIPKGAQPIENPVGTAPAFIVETAACSIISLPGVPSEMETLLTQSVLPYLITHFDLHEVIKVRTLHTSRIGEGAIDELIGDLETLANPTVGLTAHSGVVDIRIAAKSSTESEADQLISTLEKDIRARIGEGIFGADDETLEAVALQAVARNGWTLACIESGLESSLLTRFSKNPSPVYRGGTTGNILPADLAGAVKALHEEYAVSAALGIVLSSEAEHTEIHIFLLTPRGPLERRLTYGGHPKNAPRWAANMALDCLRRAASEIE